MSVSTSRLMYRFYWLNQWHSIEFIVFASALRSSFKVLSWAPLSFPSHSWQPIVFPYLVSRPIIRPWLILIQNTFHQSKRLGPSHHRWSNNIYLREATLPTIVSPIPGRVVARFAGSSTRWTVSGVHGRGVRMCAVAASPTCYKSRPIVRCVSPELSSFSTHLWNSPYPSVYSRHIIYTQPTLTTTIARFFKMDSFLTVTFNALFSVVGLPSTSDNEVSTTAPPRDREAQGNSNTYCVVA